MQRGFDSIEQADVLPRAADDQGYETNCALAGRVDFIG